MILSGTVNSPPISQIGWVGFSLHPHIWHAYSMEPIWTHRYEIKMERIQCGTNVEPIWTHTVWNQYARIQCGTNMDRDEIKRLIDIHFKWKQSSGV
jgi:hypothetical protein